MIKSRANDHLKCVVSEKPKKKKLENFIWIPLAFHLLWQEFDIAGIFKRLSKTTLWKLRWRAAFGATPAAEFRPRVCWYRSEQSLMSYAQGLLTTTRRLADNTVTVFEKIPQPVANFFDAQDWHYERQDRELSQMMRELDAEGLLI